MPPALRLPVSLLALFLAASISLRAELVLVVRSHGEAAPVTAIAPHRWTLGGKSPASCAPTGLTLDLEGDLTANANLGVWAPRGFSIVRSLPEDLHPNSTTVATVKLPFSYRVKSDHMSRSSTLCDSLWPGSEKGPTLFLVAWVVRGKVVHLWMEPDYGGGAIMAEVDGGVSSEELDGQPVLFLWRNGHFVAPVARFSAAAEQRAAAACAFDDDVALRRELAAGVKVNAADSDGFTLLHYAVKCGSERCIAALLKAGATTKISPGGQIDAPLVWAAALGRASAVEALLSAHAWVDTCCKNGDTPLISAVKCGQLDMVRRLVRAHADVDLKNESLESPITSALDAGYADIAQVLLDAYADFNFHSKQNRRAFVTQCKYGHTAVVRLYLKHRVSANSSAHGMDALGEAAIHGSAELMQLLIDAKANVNAVSAQGMTPLMMAAIAGNLPAVKTLLAAKADPSVHASKGGFTALHSASGNDRVDIVQALLDAGAPMDAKSKDGLTPLDVALVAHASAAVGVLVKQGARIDVKSRILNALIESAIEIDQPVLIERAIADGWRADSIVGGDWPAVRLAELCESKDCLRVLRATGLKTEPPAPYPIISARQLDKPMRVLRSGSLTDPRDAWENYPSQTVVVTALVTPAGTLAFPQVRRVSDERLMQQVLISLDGWRLAPPTSKGHPAGVRVTLPIKFPSSQDREFASSQVDELPRVITQERPEVPFGLRNLGTSGEVDVQFVVDPTGHTRDVVVLRASSPKWGPSAVDAVKHWTFVPGKLAGHPVSVRMVVPIVLMIQS